MGSRPSAIAPPSASGSTMASASISSAARQLSPGASGSPRASSFAPGQRRNRGWTQSVQFFALISLQPSSTSRPGRNSASATQPSAFCTASCSQLISRTRPPSVRPSRFVRARRSSRRAAQDTTQSTRISGWASSSSHTMQPLPVPAGRTSAAQFFCCSPASAARQAVLFESSTKIDISYPFCPFRGFRNSLFLQKRNAPAQSWLSCLRCARVFPAKMLLSCSIFIIKVYFLSR